MDIQHEFGVDSLKALKDKQIANEHRINQLKKRLHNNQLHPSAAAWTQEILQKTAENWRIQEYFNLHA